MEKKQTSESLHAQEAGRIIEEHGLKMTAFKRQMLQACDGQPIRVTSYMYQLEQHGYFEETGAGKGRRRAEK